MKNPSSNSSTNTSDQLALIDWTYDAWLECEDGSAKEEQLHTYLGELILAFARSNPPECLLPQEYAHFMNISRELCLSGGMSEDEFDSNDIENA